MKITQDYKTLTPAYGRDYTRLADVKEDLVSGRDFIFNDITSPWDGKPINIDQFAKGVKVRIRYNKNRQIGVFTI